MITQEKPESGEIGTQMDLSDQVFLPRFVPFLDSVASLCFSKAHKVGRYQEHKLVYCQDRTLLTAGEVYT